mgnify:CR=1 FL=1
MATGKNDVIVGAERGIRLKEEVDKIFEKTSHVAISRALGVADPTLRGWESGRDIGNDCLARLHELGADVIYILTGKRRAKGAFEDLSDEQRSMKMKLLIHIAALMEVVSKNAGEARGLLNVLNEVLENPEYARDYAMEFASLKMQQPPKTDSLK